MSKGINKVILIGNVGKDPETRYLPNGDAVVNFSLATSEEWKDKNTGEKKEATEWHKIVAFRKLAEIISKYVTKGSRLYIEGSLKTRKWTDNGGTDHYSTEIVAKDMQMLGGPHQMQQTKSADMPSQELEDDIPF